MNYLIPKKQEIERWIRSKDGRHVYETLYAIDLTDHGMYGRLNHMYYDENIAKKPQKEQFEWLKQQMPIADIRHAAYLPEIDTLLFSDPDEFLGRREDTALEKRIEEIGKKFVYKHFLVGMTATVKSNNWKIFDLLYHMEYKKDGPAVRASKLGLARRGYTLLMRESLKENGPTYYIPVLPE